MTVRPARTAAAIAFALGFSSIIVSAPAVAETDSSSAPTVTIVAALSAPTGTTGFIDSDLLTAYTSDFGVLTRELDQVIDRPIALGVDPMIIASIRVLGTSAPPTATAWLDRLAHASNETFPLTWADSDITIALQAGSSSLLTPSGFDFAIDPAHFGNAPEVNPTPTPAPAATADPTVPPPLPTADSLVAWDYTVPSLAWPAMNSVTEKNFDVIAASYETTLLSSANLVDFPSSGAAASVNGHPTIVSNDVLSTLFSTAVAARNQPDLQTSTATLLASLAGARSTSNSTATVLITLDRGVPVSSSNLGLTLDAIASAPGVQFMPLADLVSQSGGSAKITGGAQDEARVASVHILLAHEQLDSLFAEIADNPALITQQRRLDLLATLSNGWRTDSVGWAAAADSYTFASTQLRSQVSIVKSSAITLWADRAAFPVTVTNGLDQAITVFVTVRPLSPLLRVDNGFVAITVEPNSQRKAQVPVQAISNGTVELEVSLHSGTHTPIGTTKFVRTTVQAGWETPFTVALGTLVVLIFVLGIIRTIVRRRKARAQRAA